MSREKMEAFRAEIELRLLTDVVTSPEDTRESVDLVWGKLKAAAEWSSG